MATQVINAINIDLDQAKKSLASAYRKAVEATPLAAEIPVIHDLKSMVEKLAKVQERLQRLAL